MALMLDVYLQQNLVGRLIQDDHGEMGFDYDAGWVSNPAAVALSHSLPLKQQRYTSRQCRPFFGGILPEADNRDKIARNLGISSANDFAMLERIGGECAGAVTFMPTGLPLPHNDPWYHSVSEAELGRILSDLPRRPLMAGEANIRLSLAGAQDKMAVRIDGSDVLIPLGGAPSTHILKPEISGFAGSVYNEAFCMKLAHIIGLPCANVETRHIDGIDYLSVERYDRKTLGTGVVERLHQEDFCQALGVISKNKYENEGGPSLKQCFQLVRETSSVPAVDLLSLLDGTIFNLLIGNNDAHGKNFSLLYTDSKPRLAPFYDLLSTVYFPELSAKMAMKIGGEYNSDRIFARHFEKLATDVGFAKPLLKRRVRDLAQLTNDRLSVLNPAHPAEIGVAALIRMRCDRMIARLRE